MNHGQKRWIFIYQLPIHPVDQQPVISITWKLSFPELGIRHFFDDMPAACTRWVLSPVSNLLKTTRQPVCSLPASVWLVWWCCHVITSVWANLNQVLKNNSLQFSIFQLFFCFRRVSANIKNSPHQSKLVNFYSLVNLLALSVMIWSSKLSNVENDTGVSCFFLQIQGFSELRSGLDSRVGRLGLFHFFKSSTQGIPFASRALSFLHESD